jgi:hypothetical protein
MRYATCCIVVGLAGGLALAAPAPKAVPKGPLTLQLKVDRERLRPGDLVTFTLVLVNNTDSPVQLDAKPVKHLNNRRNALLNGEMFRRVEVKGGAEVLHKPGWVSFGGQQPYLYANDVTPKLAPREKRTVMFTAKVHNFARPGGDEPQLMFDEGTSRVCRDPCAFPAPPGAMKLRLVYDRGGLMASSNDVTLRVE